MLEVTIPSQEFYDEATNTFTTVKETKLKLEHSLVSLTKWESKWHKPFLGKSSVDSKKTVEETLDYIRCMTLTQNVDPSIFYCIPQSVIDQVSDYIDNPMTATWFSEDGKKGTANKEVITSEILYYQMITLGIPFECQKWHLNRLLTLIRVCAIKNAPPKKMSKKELAKRNSALNAARRKAMNSKG